MIMEKRNLCRLATILSALFAITVSTRIDMVTWQWQDDKPMGAALGLLSAFFAFQWFHYQKQQNAASGHPGRPGWLRRLFS